MIKTYDQKFRLVALKNYKLPKSFQQCQNQRRGRDLGEPFSYCLGLVSKGSNRRTTHVAPVVLFHLTWRDESGPRCRVVFEVREVRRREENSEMKWPR